LGEKLGGNWRQIKEYASDYTHYIIIGAVLFIALYFGLKYFKKKKAAR
ncbi:DedA family protein, partial [Bacillus cereus]|nr:DedA family protein [Bacillus cereus]